MSPLEHYREAERLLEAMMIGENYGSDRASLSDPHESDCEGLGNLAAAQVHATLALVTRTGDGTDASLGRCHCVNVAVGSYANQVSMKCPHIQDDRDGWVCIDTCIATEIGWLWHQGVHTLNSCCGHGQHPATVIVAPEHEPLMESLGYDTWEPSHTGHHRIYRLRKGTRA